MKALLANFRPGHPGRFFVCGAITVASKIHSRGASNYLLAGERDQRRRLAHRVKGLVVDALRNEDLTAAETRSVTQMSIEALPEPGVIDAAQTPGHSADGDDHGYWNNPPRRRRMVAKKASITGDFFEGAETWCSSSFRTGA